MMTADNITDIPDRCNYILPFVTHAVTVQKMVIGERVIT